LRCASAILFALTTTAAALEFQLPDNLRRSLKTTQRGELASDRVTVLGVTAGASTLQQVRQQLGEAASFAPWENPNFEAVCYAAAAPGDDTIVLFEAARNDPRQQVLAIVVAGENEFDESEPCARSHVVSKRTARAAGIARGMRRVTLVDAIPEEPSVQTREFMAWAYSRWVESAGRGRSCQVLSVVHVRLTAGRVNWFALVKGEDC
jgi:hypothetical protein